MPCTHHLNAYGDHRYLGSFGADTIALPGVLGGTKLSWPGLFACFDNTFSCPEANSSSCLAKNTGCPPPTHIAGQCPYGSGLEAGQSVSTLTFAACFNQHTGNAVFTITVLLNRPTPLPGMLFGQNSLTTQLVNQGLISKALGFCYQPPARNLNCAAPPISNASRLVLGSGLLPRAVVQAGGLTSLQSAPLINSVYPPNPGATEPKFPEFRTSTINASVAVFGKSTPSVHDVSKANVLWDTGAFGQAMVPGNVFLAYQDYFNKSLAGANASGQIMPCGNSTVVESICGSNFYKASREPVAFFWPSETDFPDLFN